MEPEKQDLVVIGAGWFGLAAAKTHHQLHPESSVVVLESEPTIGGVWAEHRLYPGLKTNNMLGTYEYPDFPMDTETFGVKPGQHIPGKVVNAYLSKYVEKFDIRDKIRCECKVVSAESTAEGWLLNVRAGEEMDEQRIVAKKLVVATGLTSEAFLPKFQDQESFGAPLFHSKDFLQHAYLLESATSVTVFGGTKSAWDLVYAYATKGVQVNWIIRDTGHGPAWMAPAYVTPLKKWLEKLVHTRLLTWFSPCAWGSADGYPRIRQFLHGTAVGRFITNTFWSILGGDVITLNKYDAHPEVKKLKPWSDPMVTASSFSILNYDTDFFKLVKDGTVKIHVTNIARLSPKTVHLTNGTEVKSDALCCSTGWKHVPPLRFLPDGIGAELGVPHVRSEKTFPSEDLIETVDDEILQRWPALKSLPVQNEKLQPLLESKGISTAEATNPHADLTPYTLHRFIVPPSSKHFSRRDIAFAGVLMNFTVPIVAHLQSLWIDAFFNDQLPALQSIEDNPKAWERMRYETALQSRFGKWRYPAGHGSKFPDFVFDAVPYLDLLLGDLGLKVHRKKGMLAEALEPYGPEDYRDVVNEWSTKSRI